MQSHVEEVFISILQMRKVKVRVHLLLHILEPSFDSGVSSYTAMFFSHWDCPEMMRKVLMMLSMAVSRTC